MYGREDQGVEYIRGWTIEMRSWGFSRMVVFSVFPAGNQSNEHYSASVEECKKWVNWSKQQEIKTGYE